MVVYQEYVFQSSFLLIEAKMNCMRHTNLSELQLKKGDVKPFSSLSLNSIIHSTILCISRIFYKKKRERR